MEAVYITTCLVCTVVINSIVGYFSIFIDTTTWYDFISTATMLLPVAIASVRGGINLRGLFHIIFIVVGCISLELSRQSHYNEWDSTTGILVFAHYFFKGLGNFAKVLAPVKVICERENSQIHKREVLAMSLCIVSCVLLSQEPQIYRKGSVLEEWERRYCFLETLFWFGLSLSASSYCKGRDYFITLGFLQPFLAFKLSRAFL